MWQIVVIMLVAFGADTDALEITHNDGKPLQFETQEICYAHVYENLVHKKKLLYLLLLLHSNTEYISLC